jgi:coproporphyrinogen III oxidase-like Fe-S oxidoreductase
MTVFLVMPDAEITFEANPDDLTKEYLHLLKNVGNKSFKYWYSIISE